MLQKIYVGYKTFPVTHMFINFVRSANSPGTFGGGVTDFSCSNLCVPSIVESSCCDQIKGSSFVWQTPQGRSSVGRNPFATISKISFLFFFFSQKKGCEALSRRAPCKEAIKSSALWRSLCSAARKTASWSSEMENEKLPTDCHKFTQTAGMQ